MRPRWTVPGGAVHSGRMRAASPVETIQEAGMDVRRTCPACAAEAQVLYSRPYDDPVLRDTLQGFYGEALRRDYGVLRGAAFVLAECRGCGLIFQQQVPNRALLACLYEEWIDPRAALACHHATARLGDQLEVARDAFIALSLARADERPRRTLDFGCGWGEWATMAQGFGAESWGTELSPTRQGYCSARGIRIVDEADLPDGAFDVINLNQVFEHLPQPRETLTRLRRTLRPGGIVRIAVPNGRSIKRHLRQFDAEVRRPQGGHLYAVAPLQHLSCFTTASLEALAARCGLRRVVPPWRVLWESVHLPLGWKGRLKALVRPAYLRSGLSTDLLFTPDADNSRAGAAPISASAEPEPASSRENASPRGAGAHNRLYSS